MLKTETQAKPASQSEKASQASQENQASQAKPANSAHYLFLIAGIPFAALIIAMAPALQARCPWLLIDTTVRGVAGLLLQAIPFTLIGVLVSAAVETWVTSDFIEKHAPKSTANGFLAAILAGVCVPVCDCVVVPTFSRLVARKLPLPCAVTFLCAVPVVNPVSVLATWYAFADVPAVVVMRVALGVGIALLVGFSFVIFPTKSQILRNENLLKNNFKSKCSCELNCGCNHVMQSAQSTKVTQQNGKKSSICSQIKLYIKHIHEDFLKLLPIIVCGTIVASIIRAWLGADPASRVQANNIWIAIPAMMAIAYLSSLCSSSDAVIARSLAASLPISSVLVFLLFGPMLDLKNTLMLAADCRGKFVLRLTLTIAGVCFLTSLFANWAWGFMI